MPRVLRMRPRYSPGDLSGGLPRCYALGATPTLRRTLPFFSKVPAMSADPRCRCCLGLRRPTATTPAAGRTAAAPRHLRSRRPSRWRRPPRPRAYSTGSSAGVARPAGTAASAATWPAASPRLTATPARRWASPASRTPPPRGPRRGGARRRARRAWRPRSWTTAPQPSGASFRPRGRSRASSAGSPWPTAGRCCPPRSAPWSPCSARRARASTSGRSGGASPAWRRGS
mmetsp:Transcript_44488/g.125600  ORF Transcript_44488/g.125600 Transcript_44488/m.125600 type:complete len:229 (+) Transcript_44488:231-917(+)